MTSPKATPEALERAQALLQRPETDTVTFSSEDGCEGEYPIDEVVEWVAQELDAYATAEHERGKAAGARECAEAVYGCTDEEWGESAEARCLAIANKYESAPPRQPDQARDEAEAQAWALEEFGEAINENKAVFLPADLLTAYIAGKRS